MNWRYERDEYGWLRVSGEKRLLFVRCTCDHDGSSVTRAYNPLECGWCYLNKPHTSTLHAQTVAEHVNGTANRGKVAPQ